MVLDLNPNRFVKFYSGEDIYPYVLQKKTIIQRAKFVNCRIIGPAVIAMIGNAAMKDCAYPSPIEDFFIPFNEERNVYGVIAFLDCAFINCHFHMISLLANDAMRKRIIETVNGTTAVEAIGGPAKDPVNSNKLN